MFESLSYIAVKDIRVYTYHTHTHAPLNSETAGYFKLKIKPVGCRFQQTKRLQTEETEVNIY